jgi:hypothetical protein
MIIIPKYRARFFILMIGLWATVFIMLLQFSPDPTNKNQFEKEAQFLPIFPTTTPVYQNIHRLQADKKYDILSEPTMDELLKSSNDAKMVREMQQQQKPNSSANTPIDEISTTAQELTPIQQMKEMHQTLVSKSNWGNTNEKTDIVAQRPSVVLPTTPKIESKPLEQDIRLNENVHAFYYGWYDAPKLSDPNSTWVSSSCQFSFFESFFFYMGIC